MKRILFVINSLFGGGAEKSLISLLNELESYRKNDQIDLLLPVKGGLFYSLLPDYVNEIPVPHELTWMTHSIKDRVCWEKVDLRCIYRKLVWGILNCFWDGKQNNGVWEQRYWRLWRRSDLALQEEYDVAISYMNGYSNYYVIDKVRAKKKILWLHNDYEKIGYNVFFDEPYYQKADKIVTISESCRDQFLKYFPNFSGKTIVLENITSQNMINKMVREGETGNPILEHRQGEWVLLSIGRLVPQKNFDLAVAAANVLKEEGIRFKWYVIGKGPEETRLREIVERSGLKEQFIFLGEQPNPYIYMKNADLFVQTSKYEGKSIVLDEAKLMELPIVVTNYQTVVDSIRHGVNGIVVEMNERAVAEGIKQLIFNDDIRNRLKYELKKNHSDNSDQIFEYICLLNEE